RYHLPPGLLTNRRFNTGIAGDRDHSRKGGKSLKHTPVFSHAQPIISLYRLRIAPATGQRWESTMSTHDHPQVGMPPPLLHLGGLFVGYTLDRVLQWQIAPMAWQMPVAAL